MVHEGEQAVQKRVGEGGPDRGSPMFGPTLGSGVADFIRRQRMIVIGGPDTDGDVWASMLTGPSGFADPIDDRTIVFNASLAVGDPLHSAYALNQPVGTLALDTSQVRRIRANGVMHRSGQSLVLRTEQVLRNCPKYIQTREIVDVQPCEPSVEVGTSLSAAQQRWIEAADTFFVATHSPRHGADVSHRGGAPGFVTADVDRLIWPDYVGNSFYMTFGNLELNDRSGVCFLDWESGHMLQISGTAEVDWENREAPGAQRTVHFQVERVVYTRDAVPLRWRLVSYSKFNPDSVQKEFDQ
ncbi:MAG: oxidoreductase [Rhodococcus sp.]|nr:oxidoreductase [Rhodococcus sp. (in: high G+C Gram-positive bacteria)]